SASPATGRKDASAAAMPKRWTPWRPRSLSNVGWHHRRTPPKFLPVERQSHPLPTSEDQAMKHLLTLDNLPRAGLETLLDRAQAFADGADARDALAGVAVCTLFFEPSTRTRLSFQLAAQRLGAYVLNFDASTSSATKGETDLDTFRTIEAMGVRGFVVRHKVDGAVAALAAAAKPGVALLNAGDGRSAHPTQG